jgi:predicted small integral membrane protein
MFDWMVWTLPTAVFFIAVGFMLAGMTIWELRSPTQLRKGFLPIATTRGDRLFIGLLLAAYVNLIYLWLRDRLGVALGMNDPPTLWISFAASMLLLLFIMRKG